MLDADGFDAFAEAGNPFDPAVAQRLQQFDDRRRLAGAPAAYRAFRGREATVEPMLRKKGLVPEGA